MKEYDSVFGVCNDVYQGNRRLRASQKQSCSPSNHHAKCTEKYLLHARNIAVLTLTNKILQRDKLRRTPQKYVHSPVSY